MDASLRTHTFVIFAATVVLGTSACGVGRGQGAVDGDLYIRQCEMISTVGSSVKGTYNIGTPTMPATYNMNPTFFAGEEVNDFQRLIPNNALGIRVQSNGARIEQADVLYVNIASVYDVAVALNQDLPVTTDSNVRASLALNQSCPQPEVIPTLVGTMNFEIFGSASGHISPNFEIDFGDRVRATFSFNVVDVRAATIGGIGSVPTNPAVGGQLTGFYDFIVRQGQAEQSFP